MLPNSVPNAAPERNEDKNAARNRQPHTFKRADRLQQSRHSARRIGGGLAVFVERPAFGNIQTLLLIDLQILPCDEALNAASKTIGGFPAEVSRRRAD